MADRTMTPDEMEQFLSGNCHANLATLKRDGSPQVAPVWYEYKDSKLFITTNERAAKVHNIRRDPRVSVSIATPSEPYSYVLFYGEAQVTTSNRRAALTSICVRYKGEERGRAFAEELMGNDDGVIIEMVPSRVISWTLRS